MERNANRPRVSSNRFRVTKSDQEDQVQFRQWRFVLSALLCPLDLFVLAYFSFWLHRFLSPSDFGFFDCINTKNLRQTHKKKCNHTPTFQSQFATHYKLNSCKSFDNKCLTTKKERIFRSYLASLSKTPFFASIKIF